MKKLLLLSLLVFLSIISYNPTQAQSNDLNVISPQAVFLGIVTDIPSSGKAWAGVSNTGFYQNAGLYHNPALLAIGRPYISAKVSHSPWLRAFISDLYIINAGIAAEINKRHAVGFDYTGFNRGEITFTDPIGIPIGSHKPYEQSMSLRYAYRTLRGFAIGTSLKYIHSDVYGELGGFKAGQILLADLGLNYANRTILDTIVDMGYSIGFSVLNAGNKISYFEPVDDRYNFIYTPQDEFVHTELKLGFMISPRIKLKGDSTYIAGDFNYEMAKLLVPTPPSYQLDSIGNIVYNPDGSPVIAEGYDPNVNAFQGMLQSFYDAPGGAQEEIRELIHKIGLEGRFVYKNQLFAALRGGYFHEDYSKGNRKFFTIGLGVGFMGFEINTSYLIPTESNHPLRNTLMTGVTYKYNFGGGKRPYQE